MSIIKVKNLTVELAGEKILDNVSFVLNRGDYVGLIGPNGAGKTTLVKVILGFLKPTKGKVIGANKVKIGYVPQNYRFSPIVPIAVSEVIKMAGVRVTQRVVEVLSLVGLDQSFFGRNFHELSGGQQQRVIIARALAINPDVLIFDEPLSGVDFKTKVALYQLLADLNESQELTILFVSHEVDHIVGKCSDILCLNRQLHSGCHPLDFAKGKVNSCNLEKADINVLPVHHHH